MPLYTAQLLTGKVPPNPLFTQRGIKTHTHARLNDLHYAYSTPKGEVAYDAYKANIDVFVGATLTKKVINTYATGVDIGLEDIIETPIPCPPISFTFRENTTKEKTEAFIAKMTKSKVAFEPIFKTNMLVAYTPTQGFIRNLPVFARETVTTREDTCEPRSVKWYMFMWKVVMGFLATNTYPAYMTEEGIDTICSQVRSSMQVESTKPEVANKARVGLLSAFGTDIAYGEAMDVEETIQHGHTTWSAEDLVLKAKPSPLPATVNIGAPSEVPNLPGLVCPYFHGMIIDDRHTVRKVFSQHFFRLFGATTKACKDAYVDFRRDIESLMSTTAGLALAHIVFGINMTLETQTRMFVIIESGTYHGFALLGARFAIHDMIGWVHPMSADDVKSDLHDLGTHTAAISSLVQTMNALKMTTSPRIGHPFSIDSVTTPTILSDMMASVMWTKESLEGIERPLRALSWPGATYKAFNVDNIVWAIEHLCDPNKALDPSLHFYTPAKDFKAASQRDFRILSSFGPSSFSFINAKGETFRILPPGSVDPADVINEKTKKKNLPHFLINYKPVSECLKDWEKLVQGREFKIDLKERAQAHRNLMVPGPGRDRLLASLRENFAKLEVTGGKRKNRDADAEAGSSKKAKQSEIAFSLDFDDE